MNDARTFTLTATVGDGSVAGTATITIVDDESVTTEIKLSVSPGEAKVSEDPTEITVTGQLNGMTFEEDVKVTLVLAPKGVDGSTAQRDTDFEASLRSLTIPAGEISGSTTIDVTALTGGGKKVAVKALASPIKNDDDEDVTVSVVLVTLKDADAAAEGEDPGALGFGDIDLGATVFSGAVGEEFEEELPEATGGEGDQIYSVSNNLPLGLVFDGDTRMISGTPTTAGKATVVYTVLDSVGASVAAQFTVEIGAAPPLMISVASVSATQTSIRESGETTTVSVTAELAEAAPVAGTINFTIGAPKEGVQAIRDVDYSASLHGSVAIVEGATQATTTLTITPIDNNQEDGNRVIGIHAKGSGGSDSVDITIADDETASTSISLSVSPHSVAEGAAATSLTITATLDGKVLDADAVVTVSVDAASQATRDVDYRMLFNPRLTIVAGAVSGLIEGLIEPLADDEAEDNETITLNGVIEGLTDGTGQLIITDVAMMDDDGTMMDPLAFAEGMMIDEVGVTAGSPMSATVLPEAAGGEGDITYSVSDLPDSLSFDAATRTLSGIPADRRVPLRLPTRRLPARNPSR